MVVPVPLQRSPYHVYVGPGWLDQTGKLAAGVARPGRCALISDAHVAPLYAGRVSKSLEAEGFEPVTLVAPAGEKSKSMEEAASLCEQMISAGLDRSSWVFALGGGVVGDLAGFVAAIYYRGIPYIQIPTTIVSQVDSSVGGKTGVNAAGGKNLIGAFHQPRLVIADTDTLASLPAREFNEGFAEVIKHAAIRDFSMLDALDDLPMLIVRNVAIKAAIVAEDEFETKGARSDTGSRTPLATGATCTAKRSRSGSSPPAGCRWKKPASIPPSATGSFPPSPITSFLSTCLRISKPMTSFPPCGRIKNSAAARCALSY